MWYFLHRLLLNDCLNPSLNLTNNNQEYVILNCLVDYFPDTDFPIGKVFFPVKKGGDHSPYTIDTTENETLE